MSVIAQFVSVTSGEQTGPQIELPLDTNVTQLAQIVNKLLENEEEIPYTFYVNDEELVESLPSDLSTEKVLVINYVPQAVFKVRPVCRETGTLEGHSNSVLCVQFDPTGALLASSSGDRTVRLWDIATATPLFVLKGHTDWVGVIAWAPDSTMLASGAKDCTVRLWNPKTGKLIRTLSGHKGMITALAWEPLACAPTRRIASASRDASVRVWDATLGTTLFALSGHTQAVQCLRWGGGGFIYSGGRDKIINVYNANDGTLVKVLRGHAHWINSMSLSVDYALRVGPYMPNAKAPQNAREAHELAKKNYEEALKATKTPESSGERLVTASDDGTLMLWSPSTSSKPLCRMTGHQQQVMYVAFSPDARFIASGSYDKSIRLWDGRTGKFRFTLRGHVGAVYQLAWSPDSRMLVSGSKDSTMKLWNPSTGKLRNDLPGHRDEVFTLDWSPDGEVVASGSYDMTLKLWKH